MPKLLQDKVALITGAGRTPAPAIAAALADQGAVLALNDLSPVLLDPLAETIRERGGRVFTYTADATRGMPLRAMLDEILADLERIDILVNNPRIRPDAALFTMDEWDWQRTIEMNLNGPFLMTQQVARLMQEQGGGVILNIVDANAAALEAPGRSAYAASQRGLLALAQAVARELMAYNIRVHALCPDQAVFETGPEAFPPQRIDTLPSPPDGSLPERLHSAAALSQLAVFLCSPLGGRPIGAQVCGQIVWGTGSQGAA